jgi:CHAD domain-containing protein
MSLKQNLATAGSMSRDPHRHLRRNHDFGSRGLNPMKEDTPSHPQEIELKLAQQVLREMFSQFTGNLNLLPSSDDPEAVHQARVGWRRFKSALRLFRPVLAANAAPSLQTLQPLLGFLGELRDLDAALTQTLPPLADAFAAGNAARTEKWREMTRELTKAARLQRKAARYALMDPMVDATVLSTTQWIEALSSPDATSPPKIVSTVSLQRWARRRIARQHEKLQTARRHASTPEDLHQVRILAKRLRYGIEALRPLLPRQRTERWHRQAAKLQTSLGATRDLQQACSLAATLDVDLGLVEFLRGFTAGQHANE